MTEQAMKKNLKTVSVAIPKKQFNQILDFIEGEKEVQSPDPTVASFLREAITEYLSQRGYEEVKAVFEYRQGRPARRR